MCLTPPQSPCKRVKRRETARNIEPRHEGRIAHRPKVYILSLNHILPCRAIAWELRKLPSSDCKSAECQNIRESIERRLRGVDREQSNVGASVLWHDQLPRQHIIGACRRLLSATCCLTCYASSPRRRGLLGASSHQNSLMVFELLRPHSDQVERQLYRTVREKIKRGLGTRPVFFTEGAVFSGSPRHRTFFSRLQNIIVP